MIGLKLTPCVLGDRDGRDAEDRKRYGGYFEAWENGFLCMWYKSVFPHRLHICVVNPFNETWKELPYLATPSHLIRIIVVPGKGSGFRVMVRSIITCGGPDETESACENCRYYGFNVYNSESGAWSQMTREEYNPPPYDGPECSSSISLNCQSHLFHNGLLYVVLDDPGDLLVLNAEDGSFVRQLQGLGDGGVHGWATKGDIRILFEVLVEADGDIYCVASSKNECSVWKLDESLPRWIDVSAFKWSGPAGQDQVRLELVCTVVLGHRIYASIRARLWDPRGLSDARAFVLSYDISHGTWKLINCNVPSVLFAPRPDHLSHQLPKVC